MIRRPPRSTRSDTLFPYTTLFRSSLSGECRLVHLAFPLVRDERAPAWHPALIAGAAASIATHRRIRGRLQRQRGPKGFSPPLPGLPARPVQVPCDLDRPSTRSSTIGSASCRERVRQYV